MFGLFQDKNPKYLKMIQKKAIRIGGASGFWGDAAMATPQLLDGGELDYIVYDFLAEVTMAILARIRARDANQGYATDFVTGAMAPNLADIARKGVRVISNAGGVNPEACAAALREEIARQGLDLSVAIVTGDDLLEQLEQIAAKSPHDIFTDAPFPDPAQVGSINAYLGAFPIAAALEGGADIVITGRCVDSAVTLAGCIHAFGWQAGDLDALAGGSLAGHILECGTQATGGNFTDWESVAAGIENMGYPIAEVARDGTFTVTKPDGTGGRVSKGTISEQLVYEIGDPQAYLLPDVACDFSAVQIRETGPDRVHVSGAAGHFVPDSYKTCLTWHDGFRGGHLFSFYGIEAEAKARVFADAVLKRSRAALQQMKASDFSDTSVEVIGAQSQFGAARDNGPAREVAVKIAVRHPQARGISAFIKAASGLSLSVPPGLSGFAGARPKPSPVLALFSFLTPKEDVDITLAGLNGSRAFQPVPTAIPAIPVRRPAPPAAPELSQDTITVPLIRLAWGRSGDKGDNANIGIIARDPAFLPWIWHGLSEAVIEQVYSHFMSGHSHIERYFLPGPGAVNITISAILGGGGTSSLRNDPQGKGYAQLLLSQPVEVAALVLKEASL